MNWKFDRRKMHVYQQLEHSDCGQACIRMICRYYGLRISSAYLRTLVEGGRLGMSLAEIRSVLGKLGFNTASVKLQFEQLLEAPLPCILYWNQNHFVVLYRISKDGRIFYIADPAEGKRRVRKENFMEAFYKGGDRGIILLAEPDDTFRTKIEQGQSSASSLIRFLKDRVSLHRRQYIYIIGLLIFITAADITVPFLFQSTVDKGINQKDISLIWLLIGAQLGIFLGSTVTSSIVQVILTKLGLRMGLSMLREYLDKLIRLPMSFFARKVNSDFIQKIEDHNRLSGYVVSLPQSLLFTILNLLIFGGILIWFSPLIFFIFVGFTTLSMLLNIYFLRFRRELNYSLSSTTSENRNNLFELVRGIEEVKANNAHKTRVGVWHKVQEKINRLTIRSTMLSLYQNGGNSLLLRLRDVVITGLCATMVVYDTLTIGSMMTVSYLVGRLASPFSSIISGINDAQDASMAYQRVEEIHSMPPPTPAPHVLGKIADINIENVWFAYPGFAQPMVLKGIDLNIQSGSVTAFVGASGSGKSTLLKLLLGFFDTTRGEIRYNGMPFSDIVEESLIGNVAIVMQEGTIFSASIASNIALGEEQPDIERVRKAARLACIDDFIESLPMDYSTRIGKTGLELSGGQMQRIHIARAIYREPEILMLDEATSSLDAITEARIMENIYSHFSTRTVIVAAHRLSTVRNADQIVVMEDGKVREVGSHDDLLALHGKYEELLGNQLVRT